MFTTKNVQAEKPYVSGQIQPGINIAKITAIESKPSQQGVPGIKFVFETEPVEGLEGRGQQADHVYYLNDDYDGGDIKYEIDEVEYTVPKKQGSVFIFDSNINHCVNELKTNKRYSMNVWPSKKIKMGLI
jgi:hypothetical protein